MLIERGPDQPTSRIKGRGSRRCLLLGIALMELETKA
jgi:hypothetical protein